MLTLGLQSDGGGNPDWSLILEQVLGSGWVGAVSGGVSECDAVYRLQQTLPEDPEEIKCLRTVCITTLRMYREHRLPAVTAVKSNLHE